MTKKTFVCPDELNKKLKEYAKKEGLSDNVVIEIGMHFFLNSTPEIQDKIIAHFYFYKAKQHNPNAAETSFENIVQSPLTDSLQIKSKTRSTKS